MCKLKVKINEKTKQTYRLMDTDNKLMGARWKRGLGLGEKGEGLRSTNW